MSDPADLAIPNVYALIYNIYFWDAFRNKMWFSEVVVRQGILYQTGSIS